MLQLQQRGLLCETRQRTRRAVLSSEEQKAERKRLPLLFPPPQTFLMLDLIQKKGRACFVLMFYVDVVVIVCLSGTGFLIWSARSFSAPWLSSEYLFLATNSRDFQKISALLFLISCCLVFLLVYSDVYGKPRSKTRGQLMRLSDWGHACVCKCIYKGLWLWIWAKHLEAQQNQN